MTTTETKSFDGATYDPEIDGERLATLLHRVRACMADGRWHTLDEIVARCGGSTASVSARLRDLRKNRFGGHTVDRRRVEGGVFAYRIEANDATR